MSQLYSSQSVITSIKRLAKAGILSSTVKTCGVFFPHNHSQYTVTVCHLRNWSNYKPGDILDLWDSNELFSVPAVLLAKDCFCCEQYITYIGGQHCILGGRGNIGRLGQNPMGSCPSSHPSGEHWHRKSFPTGPHSETGPDEY